MATVTLSSPNPFLALEEDPPPHTREASFSYLATAADETFSLRLSSEYSTTDTIPTSFQISLQQGRRKKKTGEDGELDIFAAEKYFSGGMDGGSTDEAAAVTVTIPEKCRKPPSPTREVEIGKKRRSGTPSSCSEISANSRSSLLRDYSRRAHHRHHYQNSPPPPTTEVAAAAGSKRFLGVFRCSCSDKNSVEVERKAGIEKHGRIPAISGVRKVPPEFWYNEETGWQRSDLAGGGSGWRREETFEFHHAGNLTVNGRDSEKKTEVTSLDVLGSPLLGKEEFESKVHRSLTMLTDQLPGGGGGDDDDGGSESSSDLFEIESFSTGGGVRAATAARDTTAGSTTWYEPSEASIEWSVVTASAAAPSEYGGGERRSPAKVVRTLPPSRSGLLLGCASEKAVRVATNARRMAPPPERKPAAAAAAEDRIRRIGWGGPVAPVMRYHPESPSVVVDAELARVGHALAARVPHVPHLRY